MIAAEVGVREGRGLTPSIVPIVTGVACESAEHQANRARDERVVLYVLTLTEEVVSWQTNVRDTVRRQALQQGSYSR